MTSKSKTLNKVVEDQLFMVKNQEQLFENMNIIVENLKYKSDHQELVIKNQNLIIKNQEIIVQNQINIINNQKKIVDNQAQLTLIIQLFTHVLNGLRNQGGHNESMTTTSAFVEQLFNTIKSEQGKTMLNEPGNLKK